ncbi:hypothetical protein BD626DRAFT_582523 [Schizophyllum amplum]|uniref:Novel STAND NTPase 1 domain-containing protein n=1 Tax=Schizophyllum amplum TaxID=97359 RepID=A0A550CL15_9AGAR|nr:hypothetical protein BD626DRAFT_582523 [Auriculariopsis ampla]
MSSYHHQVYAASSKASLQLSTLQLAIKQGEPSLFKEVASIEHASLSASTKGRRVPASAFSVARLALACVGEGASTIPGVKACTLVGIKVIEAAERLSNNKDKCAELAHDVSRLLSALVDATADKTEQDVPAELMQEVTRLTSDLEDISGTLQSMTAKSTLIRALRSDDDKEELDRCQQKIAESYRLFELSNGMQTRLILHNMQRVQEDFLSRSQQQSILRLSYSCIAPPPPPVFVGRDALLADTVEKIRSQNNSHTAILGPGGIGKTAFALAVFHHPDLRAKFKDRRVIIPCDGARDAAALLQTMLNVLGVHHFGNFGKQDGNAILLLRRALLAHKTLLLVLDNFETPWYESGDQAAVADILSKVLAVHTVTVIVTMRGSLPPTGAAWSVVGGSAGLSSLDMNDSRTLFATISHRDGEHEHDESLNRLLEALHGIPLAICLLAKLAIVQSPTILEQRWQTERTSLLRAWGPPPNRSNSLDVSISLSLRSQLLQDTPFALDLLSCIAHLPNGICNWETAIGEMFPGRSSHVLCDAAIAIITMGLAFVNAAQALVMLSPIRDFLRLHHPPSSEHVYDLERYFIRILDRAAASDEGPYSYADVLPDLQNIIVIFGCALDSAPDANLFEAVLFVARCLGYIGYSSFSLVLKAIALFIDPNEDTTLLYIVRGLNLIGNSLHSQNRLVEAEPFVQKASAAASSARHRSSELRSQWAYSQTYLGVIAAGQNRFSEARCFLQAALDVHKELCDYSAAVDCLFDLAEACYSQEDIVTGDAFFEEAKAYSARSSPFSRPTYIDHAIADIYAIHKLDYDAATPLYLSSCSYYQQHGNIRSVLECQKMIAVGLQFHRDFEGALRILDQCYKIYKSQSDLYNMAEVLQQKADCQMASEDYSSAWETLNKANAFCPALETADCRVVIHQIRLITGIICVRTSYEAQRMETGVGEVRNDQYTAGMGLGIREGLLRTVEGTGACEPWHHPALNSLALVMLLKYKDGLVLEEGVQTALLVVNLSDVLMTFADPAYLAAYVNHPHLPSLLRRFPQLDPDVSVDGLADGADEALPTSQVAPTSTIQLPQSSTRQAIYAASAGCGGSAYASRRTGTASPDTTTILVDVPRLNLSDAATHLDIAYKQTTYMGYTYGRAVCLKELSQLALETRDFEVALSHAENACSLMREASAYDPLSHCLHKACIAAYELGKHDQALALMQEGYDLCETHDLAMIMWFANAEACQLVEMGTGDRCVGKALHRMDAILRVFRKSPETAPENYEHLMCLLTVYEYMGMVEEADRCYRGAADLYEETAQFEPLARCWLELGRMHTYLLPSPPAVGPEDSEDEGWKSSISTACSPNASR